MSGAQFLKRPTRFGTARLASEMVHSYQVARGVFSRAIGALEVSALREYRLPISNATGKTWATTGHSDLAT